MKKLKRTQQFILVLLLASFFNSKAQQTIPTNFENLIVGTWVAEGNPTSYYFVYESNGVVKRYNENSLYKTYNWTIIESFTANGLKKYHLKLVNSTNSNEIDIHEIDTLNTERMVLVYQRGQGWGIAKPATYFRQ